MQCPEFHNRDFAIVILGVRVTPIMGPTSLQDGRQWKLVINGVIIMNSINGLATG